MAERWTASLIPRGVVGRPFKTVLTDAAIGAAQPHTTFRDVGRNGSGSTADAGRATAPEDRLAMSSIWRSSARIVGLTTTPCMTIDTSTTKHTTVHRISAWNVATPSA